MSREIWDAYDSDGNKLGIDLFRGESIKEDIYHIVVEIYTVTENNEILVTQRHKSKQWALKWEITGGSILKGETPEQGAIRELKEETGIEAKISDLNYVYTYVSSNSSSIYKCFVVFINKEKTTIHLQEGETINYNYLTYDEFKQFIIEDSYVDTLRERFKIHEEIFDEILNKHASITNH